MSALVEAAGGVVARVAGGGGLEVALVHRPKYDDWSFPKGKLNPGESHEQAALREVAEETGLLCRLGRALGSVRYHDRKGRAKRVRYWAMTVEGGAFAPNSEVDELRWLPIELADELLSRSQDADLARWLGSGDERSELHLTG